MGELGNDLYQSEETGLMESQLVGVIDEAQEIVCLCSFLFSNKLIEKALSRAANRGVRVYLMTASEGMLKNLDEEELEFR